MNPPRTFPRLGLAATAAVGIALCIHAWVGWLDAGRPVPRPTGHLTPVAAAVWISATVPALVFAVLDGPGPWVCWGSAWPG